MRLISYYKRGEKKLPLKAIDRFVTIYYGFNVLTLEIAPCDISAFNKIAEIDQGALVF